MSPARRFPLALIAVAGVVALAYTVRQGSAAAPAAPPGKGAERIVYNRDVRPILSDNCFYCHGPDAAHRKAKLRLDLRDEALKANAFVPGKPDESELVKRVYTKDPDDLMPPAEAHKVLSAAQKDTLRRWIEQGAEYQAHWAYITPVRPALPSVKSAKGPSNPIDTFILASLEARGIAPSKEADRATLLRRLSLDLIGLPPTPAEVEAFVRDTTPGAYERQVDRLLASPHFGERMAAPWLDAARFADTVGFHGDQNQNVFAYRDYVINAFNTNKPYDRFVTEQLAGDLLPNPTPEQLTATAFNRLNMMTREGGAQPKEYLAKYQADRVRTVGTVFLGSTFGCAECHDHKFDPIKAKDFYSMGAFFADVKQWGVYSDYAYTPNPDLKGFNNDFPFPPEITVENAYLKKREVDVRAKMAALLDGAAARWQTDRVDVAAFERWRAAAAGMTKQGAEPWVALRAVGLSQSAAPPAKGKAAKAAAAKAPPPPQNSAAPTLMEDGSILLTSPAGQNDRLEFELPAGPIAAVRLEALPDANHGDSIVRGAASTTVTLSAALQSGGKAQPLAFYHADADHKEPRYASGHALIGINGGWKTSASDKGKAQSAWYLIDAPVEARAGDKLVITLARNALARVRVSASPLAGWALASGKRGPIDLSAGSVEALRIYRSSFTAGPQTFAEFKKLNRDLAECRGGRTPVLVTQALATPLTMRVLPRGNWQDETGPIVEPATPGFLPKLPASGRLSRLDLAKWLVAPENPLTSRVMVNRLWKQFFGNGLCNSIEDLGAQGEWPSHPELLDWLAVEFRESGWDVKRTVRLIVMSATYRQTSNLRPELKEADGANRLLASQNPRRLEAEFVRDNALFAAGLLNVADIGGPSVKPYQPPGYYANIQFPDRNYVADVDDRQYRRGLYMHWQRTFLHPMLANFDAPSREDTTCTRTVSNTPQQALTLLNDPTFVEAARVFAAQVMARVNDDDARLDAIFRRALLRPAKDKELASLRKFIAANREHFKTDLEEARKLTRAGIAPVDESLDPAEWATWTSVCRVVLNLHESVTRY